MAKSLSEDLRIQVIGAVDGGLSRHAAARRFGVAAAPIIDRTPGVARRT